MSWVKVDDQFFRHPKVLAAGRDARDLYLVGLCYCAQGLTDGFIPSQALRVLAAEAEIDTGPASAARLVETGLWEPTEGGYTVHDYHEYQPTKERVIATREARAEAGSRGGKQKASNLLEQNASKTLANAKQKSTPYPSRTPTHPKDEEDTPPLPPDGGTPAAAPPDVPPKSVRSKAEETRGFDAFWEVWPKREGKAAALAAWRRVPKDPDTLQAIVDAVTAQAVAKDWPRDNFRYCPNPATWINQKRWEDEPPDIHAVRAAHTGQRHDGRVTNWKRGTA